METNKKRRSSILKPQKTRNPMSELEPANDNTATRLLTRRVSFASSNFIKEFAADPEKNTIWNVTYEEIVNKSDSTRSSENAQNTLANQQSQQLIQTTQTSTCNLEGALTTKPQESNTEKSSKSTLNVSQASLPEKQVIMKSKCQNKTVTEGCDLEFTQLCTPKNQPKFNKTSLDASTMDFTGFVDNFKPNLYSTTVKQNQEVKLKDVTLTDSSMDITDTQLNNNKIIETKPLQIESSLKIMDEECLSRREKEATQNMAHNLLIGQNIPRGNKLNKPVRLDESMEFTQHVPEVLNYNTGMEQSMDFTQMVPSSKIQENRHFSRILSLIPQNPGISTSQILNKENLEKPTNKTKFFNDSSVEFTQKIPFNQYNFQSESMRAGQDRQFQQTAAVQKSLEIAPSQLVKQEGAKTKFFNDSMDFTQSIPVNQCNFEEPKELNEPTGSTPSLALPQKKLEVVQKNPLNQYNLESEKLGKNQQTLLQQNSEITPNLLVLQESAKTKFFNESMDFTESVPVNRCNFEKPKEPNEPTGNIPSLALPQKKLEVAQKNPLNQYNLESEKVGKNQEYQQSLLQQNSEIAPSPFVLQESVKTKLFNDTMEFTLKPCSFEGLQKPSDRTQNTALFQKTLEITQSKIARQDNVKTKLFSDSLELTENLPLNQYNFERQENVRTELSQPSDGTQNTALLQKPVLRIMENQSKLFESMEIPDEVPLNSETFPVEYQPTENTKQIHNLTKTWNESARAQMVQEMSVNKGTAIHSMQTLQISGIRDLTQNVSFPEICNDNTEVVPELSLGARKVIQKQEETLNYQNSGIAASQILNKKNLEKPTNNTTFFNDSVELTQKIPLNSKLFESVIIPDEVVPLNSETFLVQQCQQKENTKQIHNWTQTWNDSAQMVQEMSVNRGTAIHSALQISGIKDLTQNVSFPEMCNDSTEVAQESSLGARKVIQNQEESWQKLCNTQLLQQGTTSREHIDAIQSNKPFWSDSYEVMIKYECEGLLDEITPPLHDSLSSSDCSPLHVEKPILSFSKTEIPFRTNLRDFEVYLENAFVEMEEINKSLTELKGELLSKLTLPQHAMVNYEKIDFEVLQNYSFENDMDLASDDSSTDDSLLHLNFNSNENDEAALTIREKIQNKNSRCKNYCSIIYAEDSKCKLDTLFGSIRLEVDFDCETGEVNKIEICDRLSDKSQPSALLAHKVFMDTLSLKHIRAAVGEHYDILTLMDYIYMNMQKIVDFMSDLDTFTGHFGLEIDSSFSVKFNMVSITLKIVWWITVNLSDMENISENNITAVAEVGSLKDYNVKTFLNNCPRGTRFLSAFINNILSHIELLETQRKKK